MEVDKRKTGVGRRIILKWI